MVQLDISIPPREQEESKIATHWLRRIQLVLEERSPAIFQQALRIAGITPAELETGNRIRLSQLDIVQRYAREQMPDITLRMYAIADLLDLGLMGYAIASSGTVAKALQIARRYHELTTDRYALVIEQDERDAIIRPILQMRYLEEKQDIAEDNLSGMWSMLRQILGPNLDSQRVSVHFDYPAPAYADAYFEVFSCPCHFDAERTEMRFPAAWLQLPVTSANLATAGICADMCERLLGGGKSQADVIEAVQRLLLGRPRRHILRLEEAAEQLNMSVSQLRKKLYRLGTSYKQIVLDVRMVLARHYLEGTGLPIKEIAYLLDYADPPPFCRAFKQYYGVAPQHYRNEKG